MEKKSATKTATKTAVKIGKEVLEANARGRGYIFNPDDEIVAGPSSEEVSKSKQGKLAIGIVIGAVVGLVVLGIVSTILW